MKTQLTYSVTKAIYDQYIKLQKEIEEAFLEQYEKSIKTLTERGLYDKQSDYVILNTNKESVK